MGCLAWILVGLVAGALAKLLVPGKDPGGAVVTIILGIAGASLGGWLGTQLGFGSFEGFDLRSMLMAVGGSILLLLVFRMIRGAKKSG